MNDATAELVRRMRDGDGEAFDGLYRQYVGRLYGMAWLLSASRPDSEDIVQEAFVTCFLHRKSLRDENAFEPWLYRILVRTAWRYLKKRGRDSSYEALTDPEQEAAGGRLLADQDAPEPLEEAVKNEERRLLWQAVGELDLKQRTAVVLYYYGELSVREIARATGSLEGTVKSRLHKGRENLRRCLLQDLPADEGRKRDGNS